MQQTIRSAPLSGQQECPQPDLCNFQMREGKASFLLGNVFLQKSDHRANSSDKLLHCTKAHIRVLAVELSCLQSELLRSLLRRLPILTIGSTALLLLWQFGATSANGITNKFDPKVIIEGCAIL
jgi:hypothetical protein